MSVFRKERHEHKQTVPASTWRVQHNFGREPIVDVYLDKAGGLQKVLPSEVRVITAGAVVDIELIDPVTGIAVLA